MTRFLNALSGWAPALTVGALVFAALWYLDWRDATREIRDVDHGEPTPLIIEAPKADVPTVVRYPVLTEEQVELLRRLYDRPDIDTVPREVVHRIVDDGEGSAFLEAPPEWERATAVVVAEETFGAAPRGGSVLGTLKPDGAFDVDVHRNRVPFFERDLDRFSLEAGPRMDLTDVEGGVKLQLGAGWEPFRLGRCRTKAGMTYLPDVTIGEESEDFVAAAALLSCAWGGEAWER